MKSDITGQIFWIEGNRVLNGRVVTYITLPDKGTAVRVRRSGKVIDVLLEDIYLSHGAAMKDIAKMAGI